jgi:hypothetical protein
VALDATTNIASMLEPLCAEASADAHFLDTMLSARACIKRPARYNGLARYSRHYFRFPAFR